MHRPAAPPRTMPPMPRRSRQFHRPRLGAARIGLILAGATLAILALVVLMFIVRTPAKARGQAITTSTGPAPDIKQLPQDPTGINSLKTSGRFFAQIVAKDDPTRMTGEISALRYEPLEQQRFR